MSSRLSVVDIKTVTTWFTESDQTLHAYDLKISRLIAWKITGRLAKKIFLKKMIKRILNCGSKFFTKVFLLD